MQIIYEVVIRIYYFLILISSLFNVKAKLWITGRKNIFEELKKSVNNVNEIVWIHCASLGEFEQGRPLIEEFKKQFPQKKILLTFFSPSGYEVRKNYTVVDWVFYMPFDSRSNVNRFLDIVKPEKVIFVKYEFWNNFITGIHKRNIPFYLVSANFRSEQLFFKKYGGWYRNMLKKFTHLFVQNVESENLLKSINIYNVTVAGDTRFDRVFNIAKQSKNIPEAEIFSKDFQVLIAGSTWPKDEEILVPFINNIPEKIKFIIAQHEISENGIQRLEKSLSVKSIRFSNCNCDRITEAKVLIIDNVGMLSSLYKYGTVAYIGGGFGKGIHNILEAAVFGQPVIFGPNFSKFSEAVELVNAKGAFSINDYNQLEKLLVQFFGENQFLKNTSDISRQFVEKRVGATELIMKIIS